MKKQMIRLEGIHPFNEFFYCSCFYSNLIPVLRKYHIPIDSVLVNCLPFYTMFEDRIISVEYRQFAPLQEILKEQGILIKGRQVPEGIKDVIQECLAVDYPLIIYVDCFCLPHREDTYQTLHLGHTLLIYGYDFIKNTVITIEHSHRDNLDFKEYEIPMSVLEESHTSFIVNVSPTLPKQSSLLTIKEAGNSFAAKTLQSSYYPLYLQYRQSKIEDMLRGVTALEHFLLDLMKDLIDSTLFYDCAEEYFEHFFYICKAKKGEFKLLELINANSILLGISEQIYKSWIELSQMLQYCVTRRRCKEKSFIRIQGIVEYLVSQEKLFCQELQNNR